MKKTQKNALLLAIAMVAAGHVIEKGKVAHIPIASGDDGSVKSTIKPTTYSATGTATTTNPTVKPMY